MPPGSSLNYYNCIITLSRTTWEGASFFRENPIVTAKAGLHLWTSDNVFYLEFAACCSLVQLKPEGGRRGAGGGKLCYLGVEHPMPFSPCSLLQVTSMFMLTVQRIQIHAERCQKIKGWSSMPASRCLHQISKSHWETGVYGNFPCCLAVCIIANDDKARAPSISEHSPPVLKNSSFKAFWHYVILSFL